MITRYGWQGQIGLLSPREVEFTLAVAAGMTDKQIAREAGLAPDSVRKRIANAMYKLGASRRAQLVAEAIKHAVITPLVLLLAMLCISIGGHPEPQQDRHVRTNITRIRPYRRPDSIVTLFHYL